MMPYCTHYILIYTTMLKSVVKIYLNYCVDNSNVQYHLRSPTSADIK